MEGTPGRKEQKLENTEQVPSVHQNLKIQRVVVEDTTLGVGDCWIMDILEHQTKNFGLWSLNSS